MRRLLICFLVLIATIAFAAPSHAADTATKDRIVGPQQDNEAPDAEYDSVSDRTEPVVLLPSRRFGYGQRRISLLVAVHLKCTRQAHHHEKGHA